MSSVVCASYGLQTCKVSMQQRAAHSLRVFPRRPYVGFPMLPLTTLRTAVQQRGKAAISAAGPSHPDWDSLFASASLSADDPHATILAETSSVDGSASCKQYVARKQLNQLFQTLSAEKHITAMQNFKCCQSCGHRAIDEHASVDDIGYCFFHAQDAERLATTGSVSLIFGGLTSDYELHLRVAETIYDTAVACNLPVQWDGKLHHRIQITGFDPEEFADWKHATGGIFEGDRVNMLLYADLPIRDGF